MSGVCLTVLSTCFLLIQVRQEKQKERRQKMPAMGMPERAKAPHGELDVQRPGNKNM